MPHPKPSLHPLWAAALAACATGCFVDRSPIDPAFDAGGGRDAGADARVIEPDGGEERDAGRDGCSPRAELCNGEDDDCDGMIDEAITESCSTVCGPGVRTCSDGALGACSAPAPGVETCNGMDDDCDGMIDEALSQACSTTCGAGTETCSSGAWGGCTAPVPGVETCNGMDDDCDGTVDEALTQACSTTCGAGTETCSGGAWGGCTAPTPGTETCNGVDDDCDGTIDEGGVCTCAVRYNAGSTYLFCDTRAAWTTARDACAAVGYTLVTIDSATENTWVGTTAFGISDSDWWIGLNDIAVENTHVWVSGSTSTYRAWQTGEPSGRGEDCAAIVNGSGSETRGQWVEGDCASTIRYVCEVP